MKREFGTSFKTLSLAFGTIVVLFIATQCLNPGTLAGRTTGTAGLSSAATEIKGGVGPAGLQPHLW